VVSSDGAFIYEFYDKITKIDAATGIHVGVGVGVKNAANEVHVFNNLALTPDNQYLIYTTGALLTGD